MKILHKPTFRTFKLKIGLSLIFKFLNYFAISNFFVTIQMV